MTQARRAAARLRAAIVAAFALAALVSLLLDAPDVLQANPRPLRPREQPASLQRAADPRALAPALHGDALPALARQHARSSASRSWRSRFCWPLPAAYALARLTGTLGRAGGHRHVPDVPGAADPALHPALARRRHAGPAGLPLVAGRGLPDLHGAVRDLAADGLLQVASRATSKTRRMVDGLSRFGAFVPRGRARSPSPGSSRSRSSPSPSSSRSSSTP